MGEEGITRLVFDLHHALLGVARDLDTGNVILVDNLLDDGTRIGVDVFQTHDINLVDDEKGRFASKEGFDGME